MYRVRNNIFDRVVKYASIIIIVAIYFNLVDVDVGEHVSSAADASEPELVHHDGFGLLFDDGIDVGVAAAAGEVVKVGDFVGVYAHLDLHVRDFFLVEAVLVGEDFTARKALHGDDHTEWSDGGEW